MDLDLSSNSLKASTQKRPLSSIAEAKNYALINLLSTTNQSEHRDGRIGKN
jgi:hypothetical protein